MFCWHVFGNISGRFRGILRFFGNFAGFRRNTWISWVCDRTKYQKPCISKYSLYHSKHGKPRPGGCKIVFHKYAAKLINPENPPSPHPPPRSSQNILAFDHKAWKHMEVNCWHHWWEHPWMLQPSRDIISIDIMLMHLHVIMTLEFSIYVHVVARNCWPLHVSVLLVKRDSTIN